MKCDLWKFRHLCFPTHLPRALVTTLSRQESTRADSTLCHRHHRFSNSSLWCQALISISRLLLVSVTRTQGQTVHRVNFISLTLKWHLQHRRMFSQLQKRCFMKPSKSSSTAIFTLLKSKLFILS